MISIRAAAIYTLKGSKVSQILQHHWNIHTGKLKPRIHPRSYLVFHRSDEGLRRKRRSSLAPQHNILWQIYHLKCCIHIQEIIFIDIEDTIACTEKYQYLVMSVVRRVSDRSLLHSTFQTILDSRYPLMIYADFQNARTLFHWKYCSVLLRMILSPEHLVRILHISHPNFWKNSRNLHGCTQLQ